MADNLLADFCERQQREHRPKKSEQKNTASKKKFLTKCLHYQKPKRQRKFL